MKRLFRGLAPTKTNAILVFQAYACGRRRELSMLDQLFPVTIKKANFDNDISDVNPFTFWVIIFQL
jgi:hypothetical protein